MRLIRTAIFLIAAIILFTNFSAAQPKEKRLSINLTATKVAETEIAGGLKEAFSKGVKFAVNSLGRENGFLDNARVKIPLPKSLLASSPQ